MCASQQDTGGQREPQQPHTLSPPSARLLRPSSKLLTFRPPARRHPSGDEPSRGDERSSGVEPLSGGKALSAIEPPPGNDLLPDNGSPQQRAQAQTFENASASVHAARLPDASLIVIGAALFLGALATLTQTWAWSWHAGAGKTFTLSAMHGVCTSAMGELAQGASGTVESHCLWVDGTWTEAVLLIAAGCAIGGIGIARILHAIRKPT